MPGPYIIGVYTIPALRSEEDMLYWFAFITRAHAVDTYSLFAVVRCHRSGHVMLPKSTSRSLEIPFMTYDYCTFTCRIEQVGIATSKTSNGCNIDNAAWKVKIRSTRLGGRLGKFADLSTVLDSLASQECCILPSDNETVNSVNYVWWIRICVPLPCLPH